MNPVRVKGKFSEERDLLLLRETLAIDAFSFPSGSGWRRVADSLHRTGKVWDSLTGRTCRERVALLLDRYKEEQEENETSMIKKEPELVDEKSALLQRLLQLRNESRQRRRMTDEEKAEENRMKRDRAERDRFTISDALRQKIMDSIGQSIPDESIAFQGSDTYDSVDFQQSAERQAETSNTSKPRQIPEMRGKKRRLKEAFLEYLMKKEDNRARERREEIELRRQELDLLRDQNSALMNLLTQHLAK